MAATILISPFGVEADSLPGGTQYLNNSVKLAPLSDEHKARIVEYLDSINEDSLSRNVRTKPAFLIPVNDFPFLKSIPNLSERSELALQVHRFSLEYFSAVSVPMAAFALEDDKIEAHSVDHDGLRFRDGESLALPAGAWDKQAAYLQFAYTTIGSAPAADVALRRICRAFRQGCTPDGIIDLAIALECLVDAKLEIKFQFSLYHALINHGEPAQRAVIFEKLKTLYDVRSLNVHGGKPGKSEKKKTSVINDEWFNLITIARDNLTYYMQFCKTHGSDNWSNHLTELAFGADRLQVG